MCPSGHRCDGSFCAQSGVLAEVTARRPPPRAPAIDSPPRQTGFPVGCGDCRCVPSAEGAEARVEVRRGPECPHRGAGGPRRRRRRREAGGGRRGCPHCPWRLSRAAPARMGSWRWCAPHRPWALGGGSAAPQEPPLGCGAYCSEQGFCVARASAGLYDCRNPLSPRRMTRNQRKCAVRLPRQGAAAHWLTAGQACNTVALAEAGVVEGVKAALGLDSGNERTGAAALVGEGGCAGFCDHKGQCGPLRDEAVYNCTDARNPQQIGATSHPLDASACLTMCTSPSLGQRVLYVIRTYPKNYNTKLMYQARTWMKSLEPGLDAVLVSSILDGHREAGSFADVTSLVASHGIPMHMSLPEHCENSHGVGLCCQEAVTLMQLRNGSMWYVRARLCSRVCAHARAQAATPAGIRVRLGLHGGRRRLYSPRSRAPADRPPRACQWPPFGTGGPSTRIPHRRPCRLTAAASSSTAARPRTRGTRHSFTRDSAVGAAT